MAEQEHQPVESAGMPELELDRGRVNRSRVREVVDLSDIEDEINDGVSFGEILEGLGGYEEAERVVGTDYANYLRDKQTEEMEAALRAVDADDPEPER